MELSMKTSILARNGLGSDVTDLISRLVKMIPWPAKRQAMGDVTISLLDEKPRVAEASFGWNRKTVEIGINEFRSGITCVNDVSNRRKPKVEEKHTQLIADIHEIMEPQTQAESHLRTTLNYTNMTAKAVYNALQEKGWTKEILPTIRTISNILNRHDYRLRTVDKSKVQKKLRIPMKYLKMFGQ